MNCVRFVCAYVHVEIRIDPKISGAEKMSEDSTRRALAALMAIGEDAGTLLKRIAMNPDDPIGLGEVCAHFNIPLLQITTH